MFDIGWTELAVIAVVALIVIGPKDLPVVLKTLGTWIRKARMLTREFQSSIDDMVREAELEEVRKQALDLKQMNVGRQIEKTIDPTGTLRNAFDPEAGTGTAPAGKAKGEGTPAIPSAPAPAEPPAQAVPAAPAAPSANDKQA